MTDEKRWLVIVALGATFWATSELVNAGLAQSDGGWFNYVAEDGVVLTPSSASPWCDWLVRMAAIAIWGVLSSRILPKGDDKPPWVVDGG